MPRIIACICLLSAAWASSAESLGQAPEKDYGFKVVATSQTTGIERASQSSLWVLEIQFKSLRQVQLDLPDPKTGQKRKEIVQYLIYRVVNRGLGEVKEETEAPSTNSFDPEAVPPLFIPEISLITQDNGPQNIYDDRLIPAAEKEIRKREQEGKTPHLPLGVVLKNSVKIAGAIPREAAPGMPPEMHYGLAMWRGVDPTADRFTIMLSGFSNGYKLVRGPVTYQELLDRVKANKLTFSDQIWDGKSTWKAASETYNLFDEKKPLPADPEANIWFYTTTYDRVTDDEEKPIVWRKTLIQRFWRPGDELNRQEKEYRFDGEPEWIYQPDDIRFPVVKRVPKIAAAAKPVNNATEKPAAEENK